MSDAPTASVCDPPVFRVPVPDGILVKPLMVIVAEPGPLMTALKGNVTANVKPGAPVTVNPAGATVPVVAGSVTPVPPVVRVPPGASVMIPPDVADTAALPKFISVVFITLTGTITFADAPAFATDCAEELLLSVNRITDTIAINNKFFFFMFSHFLVPL